MTIESDADLEGLRAVGRLVGETLRRMVAEVRPGITTAALDEVAEEYATTAGARSAPQLTYDFPGFTCISINDQIVHGIPRPRAIRPGDVVKLDVTLELDGYVADSATTVLVPPVSFEAQALRRCARRAFAKALDVARPGVPVWAIGRAIEREVRRAGFFVIRELTGHGVGRGLHEAPAVPNFMDPSATTRLTDGLVIAVEPMITSRPTRVVEDADGWTLRTTTGAVAVHHEHTIVIRHGRPETLTAA